MSGTAPAFELRFLARLSLQHQRDILNGHLSGQTKTEFVLKAIIYPIAIILALLGLSFVISAGRAENSLVSLGVGGVCMLAAAAMVVMARTKAPQHTHIHKTELEVTGDVSLEKISCQQCSAELSSESVSVAAGAVYVKCEYCGAEYQIEEQAKW